MGGVFPIHVSSFVGCAKRTSSLAVKFLAHFGGALLFFLCGNAILTLVLGSEAS